MTNTYHPLTGEQIQQLQGQGCCAQDWGSIKVAGDFDPHQFFNATFLGTVQIGALIGTVAGPNGMQKPSGIYNATVSNCSIGNNTRIANVGVHLANYHIGDNVSIEDIGTMQTNPGGTFGNGVEVAVLNEAGGREVILFDQLSSQFAYIQCLHRYRPEMIKKLNAMAVAYADSVRSDMGVVGDGAVISSVDEIIDVKIGSFATVNGVSSLINGTVLSTQDAPTYIGSDVIANDFIIAESCCVSSGALLKQCFVGQGCQVGRHYSAENCLFFANCEAFGGEGCSAFCGPYSVTHHKSTLLIAGLFSFYNAGSGSNQSNHLYRLGPVHEGKVLRGSKTGSFSYLKWPCRVGPFSVVVGKHTAAFDTADYPFSQLVTRPDGKTSMIPGLRLTSVGTLRDGAKWPRRDRRKGGLRDKISYDVLSPYTVGLMVKAVENLKTAGHTSGDEIPINGTIVTKSVLKAAQEDYHAGIELYLLEKVVEKAQTALEDRIGDLFAVSEQAIFSDQWVDVGGLIMPQQRLVDLHNAVECGAIASVDAFIAAVENIADRYDDDQWLYVKNTYKQYFKIDLDTTTKEDITEIARSYFKAKIEFLNRVLVNAQKEFSQSSQCGFGQDGTQQDISDDFESVRGSYAENAFVKDMNTAIADLQTRFKTFEQILANS